MSIEESIKNDISTNQVMLYIKGEKGMPQCGFSAAVMDVFDRLNTPYESRNVLASPELREGIKKFTNWPTIPQVFINGEFVGGCDITLEMYRNGELQKLVNKPHKK